MGNTDSIPVVSQIKSATQAIAGDSAGALRTQENFAYNNTFPVISQIASAGYAIGGEPDKALDLQKKFAKDLERVIATVPVVGHLEGGLYYALGEKDKGEQAMKAASRSTGVVIGGVGGFLAGGPVGAIAGGVAGGAVADGIITGSDILAKGKENATASGYIAIGKQVKDAVDGKSKLSVDEAFDMAMLPVSDGVGGLVSGQIAGEVIGSLKPVPAVDGIISTAEGKLKPVATGEVVSKGKLEPIDLPAEKISNAAKLDKVALDNRANQLNPNHGKSGPGRSARYRGKGTKADLDNRANQLNPNNKAYAASRGKENTNPAAAATLNANPAQETLQKGSGDSNGKSSSADGVGLLQKAGSALATVGSGLLTVFGGLWQAVLALITIVVLILTIISTAVSCICKRRSSRIVYAPIDSSNDVLNDVNGSDTAPLVNTSRAGRQNQGFYGSSELIC